MSVMIKLNQDVINSIYNTNAVQPKKVKDFLHDLWMMEVNAQASEYEYLEGKFSWLYLRTWTHKDSLHHAQEDCPSFNEFLKGGAKDAIHLSDEERSLGTLAGNNLDALYTCGTIISMHKRGEAMAVYVNNPDLKNIRQVINNQAALRDLLKYIGEGYGI